MATTPELSPLGKRKADEITADEIEEGEATDIVGEPESKKVKVDHMDVVDGRWNIGMEMPQGKPRPKFIGESEEDRASGDGTVEDPKILWLGKIPLDAEVKRANEDIARRAALDLETITHIYIRCGAQSSKFVDRDGKRILIWNPDSINFHHRTTAADPHMSLAFGTDADNLVLYGYINVTVDENGKPTDFAASRNADYVVDGDDRIFELFPFEAQQHDCSPYCPTHGSNEVLVDSCEYAQPRRCPLHNTENLLDHFCRRTRWRSEIFGDHHCPCFHDKAGLLDHYCPCPHDKRRLTLMNTSHHCPHRIPKNAKLTHYCPFYPFRST
ncbi:hypothetical protein F4781DRAFT_411192 [Annulohypoxylon bovei var. microspora]|nr:hypothetical protein F4781DRAFT_411192 [Annulohypoxylon bovei var. microspora]